MQPIDFETARRRMVDRQIRPWEVVDERVIEVIRRTPREDYVPAEHRNLAYADMNVPLGRDQVMMAPKLAARLLQELGVRPNDKVLEVGSGTGYVTALLAGLAKQVCGVEINPELAELARRNLAAHNITNVTIETGDAARGWSAHAPYDAILLNGSTPLLAPSLREQLAPGGRLVAIVGGAPAMEAIRIERLDSHNWKQTSLLETVVPPLRNAPEPSKFVF
jgi:protein-L-isoaspartate(D-aspartate) O-methyltransferase